MDPSESPIHVRLPEEGLVLEGTIAPFVNRFRYFKHPSRVSLRFHCPCGSGVDTSAMEPGQGYRVDSGYLVQCPGCRRWYFHNCRDHYVESVSRDKNVIDSLFQRLPDEYGFIRGLLATPDDAGLWDRYVDYLHQRGDVRAEALRLKREIARTSKSDPRRSEFTAQLEGLRADLDPEWFALMVRMGPAALCLIGTDNDLAELPQRLLSSIANVRPAGDVRDGDFVVFCISTPDGPTEGTREAIDCCRGHSIIPVGIALTRAELVNDSSLQDLVTYKSRDLLMNILPQETVDQLPVFYDFDPWLAEKLLTCISDAQ